MLRPLKAFDKSVSSIPPTPLLFKKIFQLFLSEVESYVRFCGLGGTRIEVSREFKGNIHFIKHFS